MTSDMDLPLFEDDLGSAGVIEPGLVVAPNATMPERVVLCFFGDIVTDLVAGRARRVATLTSEAGKNPIWEIERSGQRLAVYQPGVGAPLAAGFLEEVIAMGGRRFVACGGAGALVPGLDVGHPVVVDSAVRDEGTSHHYAAPARVIEADPHAVAVLRDTLARRDVAHLVGRSWTTDALYRETRARAERRVAEGCVVVEMEAAALFAVARYREVTFGQLLIAGDTLAGETWDDRGWMSARAARERLFWLAAEAALAL
jgi:uridine phosphorylase